jgi:hypothetical protein
MLYRLRQCAQQSDFDANARTLRDGDSTAADRPAWTSYSVPTKCEGEGISTLWNRASEAAKCVSSAAEQMEATIGQAPARFGSTQRSWTSRRVMRNRRNAV